MRGLGMPELFLVLLALAPLMIWFAKWAFKKDE